MQRPTGFKRTIHSINPRFTGVAKEALLKVLYSMDEFKTILEPSATEKAKTAATVLQQELINNCSFSDKLADKEKAWMLVKAEVIASSKIPEDKLKKFYSDLTLLSDMKQYITRFEMTSEFIV